MKDKFVWHEDEYFLSKQDKIIKQNLWKKI